MPTKHEWVQPEVFLEHHEVTVYHAYNDHEYDDRLHNWYAVGAGLDGVDPDGIEFDVRMLPSPFRERIRDYNEEFEAVLRDAIDAGVVTNQGINHNPTAHEVAAAAARAAQKKRKRRKP